MIEKILPNVLNVKYKKSKFTKTDPQIPGDDKKSLDKFSKEYAQKFEK